MLIILNLCVTRICTNKLVFSNNGPGGKSNLFDGGEAGEHSGVGLVQISNIFAMQDIFYSIGTDPSSQNS